MYSNGKQTLDNELKQLALEAKQHPPKTRERQVVLGKILSEISRYDLLSKPRKGELHPYVYKELYSEARQEIGLFICRNIDKYNPDRGEFMAWINNNFFWRFKDVIINWNINKNISPPCDIESVTTMNETRFLTDILRTVIEEDPEGIFKKTHIENHPEANFQALALRRLNGEAWEEIAAELGIKSVTLRVFYHRNLKKFQPKLKGYLEE